MRSTAFKGRGLRAGLASVGCAMALAGGASAASAATYTVATPSDDATSGAPANCRPVPTAACSLRDAIAAANVDNTSTTADVIDIPAGNYGVDAPLPVIDANVSLVATDPKGAQVTIVQAKPAKVSNGSFNGSVVTIGDTDVAPTVSISGLTITGGFSDGSDGNGGGAGIAVVEGATLTLTDSEVSDNHSSASDGGGGIANFGTLNMDRDAIVSNLADSGSGGGIFNDGVATIRDSTVSDNTNTGNQTVVAFAVPAQATPASGVGGGIVNGPSGTLTLVNDTIFNNSGPGAGGLYVQQPDSQSPGGGVNVQNTVFAFNQTPPPAPPPPAAVRGAVRAAVPPPTYQDCGFDPLATLVDNGNNSDYDSMNSCGFAAAKADLVSTDPVLGALGLNGGNTENRLPANGSPVIDTGSTVNCPARDQRGLGRPSGKSCEIGADEVQVAPTPTPTPTPAPTPAPPPPPPATGVQAAQASAPVVHISGVPAACVRRTLTVHVRVVSSAPLTAGTLSLDGHQRKATTSVTYTLRIDVATLRTGRHHLVATATNSGGRGRAFAGFSRCASATRQPPFTG